MADALRDRVGSMTLEGGDEMERLRREVESLRRALSSAEAGVPAASPALEVPFDELDIRDQIGGGGFSVVYRAFWRGTPVAVKRWLDPDLNEQVVSEFRAEVMTMQNLRHPHCVQLVGACSVRPNLCIVMEYVPFSLHGILHQSPNVNVDRKRALNFGVDVARALAYLHSRSPPVVHRDVKPANFLVDRAYKVKLCDFGLCSARDATAGTPNYMAPELLNGKPYNEKVDVYAFALVLWETIAREVPFDGMLPGDIKRAVGEEDERPEMPLSCPRAVQRFIAECWDKDPGKRPGFEEIIERLQELARDAS